MKKIFLTLLATTFLAFSVTAQTIDDFYLPNIRTNEQAAKYIGQKVQVYDVDTKDSKWDDVYRFEHHFNGTIDRIYTITKIKIASQAILYLEDQSGAKIKVPVNLDGAKNYKGLASSNIFFLIDKFNSEKNKTVGKTYKNANGENVAVIDDIEIVKMKFDSPLLVFSMRSLLTNEKFLCKLDEIEKYIPKLGKVLEHPDVKCSYKLVGLNNYYVLPEYETSEKAKYSLQYVCQNTTTGELRECSVEDVETTLFKYDLSGRYISDLSNVEKPSNPEIRYGETTVIESDNAASKFSYKDNVIDIIIFATSDSFNFALQNISGNTIKIVWDEAVFVGFDGNTEKVMHKGTKYADRNESQPATTIIRNAKWEDTVIPTNLVYYRESKYLPSGWETKSMYPEDKGLKGQVMLMLPIQIKDVINEYIFVFDVKYIYNHPERLNITVE